MTFPFPTAASVSRHPTRILGRRDVEAVFTMADALAAVTDAFAA